MLRAIYVYDRKQTKQEGYSWAKWKKHTRIKDTKMSRLWFEPCDLPEPEYYSSGDYCMLCTQNAPNTPITDVVEYWGACKDCSVTSEFMDCDDEDTFLYKYLQWIISEVKGRPIVFFYNSKDDPSALIDDAIRYLNEINEFLGVQRVYKNGEALRKEKLKAKEKEREEMEKRKAQPYEPPPPRIRTEPISLWTFDENGKPIPPKGLV